MACALAASRPLATICRGAAGAAGLLALAIALTAPPARAQTPPSPPSDLLQPSLQGNPANATALSKAGPSCAACESSAADQRLHRVFADRSDADLRQSQWHWARATPATIPPTRQRAKEKNAPRRRPQPGRNPTRRLRQCRRSRCRLPPPAAPPQNPPLPEVYPKNAARRPGAIIPPPPDELPISNPPPEVHPLSAANRPGAQLQVPPVEYFDYSATTAAPTLLPLNAFPLGTLPQKPLPIGSNDPFGPVGIRAGSFLLLPSVDLSGVYSTNPGHGSPTGPASAYFVAAPELQVASDWERHSLTADIVGSYTEYASSSSRSVAERPVSQFQNRRPRRRDARHANPARKSDHCRDRQSRQPQPADRSSPNCRSTRTLAVRSGWRNNSIGFRFRSKARLTAPPTTSHYSPTAKLRPMPTATSTNMPPSCGSAMKSTRA